jgi:hypothetical protein
MLVDAAAAVRCWSFGDEGSLRQPVSASLLRGYERLPVHLPPPTTHTPHHNHGDEDYAKPNQQLV